MPYAPLYKVIKVESVMTSLWELGPVIFGPTEDFVSWLQNKGLLASSRTCSSCSGAVMRLGKRGDVSDGCGDVPSARLLRVSVREVVLQSPGCLGRSGCYSFTVGCASTLQRMPLKRQRWTLTQLVTSTGTFLEVCLKMSIILCYVYRWFRETTLLNTTILLGGPGKIVKVDFSANLR